LIAGEILSGGKQDRIVGSDRIVKPTNAPEPLDVFCVEHGRWTGGPAFGQSRVAVVSSGGGSAGGTVTSGSAGGLGGGSGSGIGVAGRANDKVLAMAAPTVRESAEAKKSQSEVWSKVGDATRSFGVVSSTGALAQVYEDKRVTRDLDQYDRSLRDRATGKNVVGVVVIISGKPMSADVFASPSLFQNYWPKLLKSYALEAASQDSPANKEDTASAGLFLSRVEGRSSSQGQDGLYRLTEHQSGVYSSFELEYTAMTPSLLVHFNRVVGK
jgi:hypothetical protein